MVFKNVNTTLVTTTTAKNEENLHVSAETIYGDHFYNCPFRGLMALTRYGVNLRQCYVLPFCYQRSRYGGDFDYTVSLTLSTLSDNAVWV